MCAKNEKATYNDPRRGWVQIKRGHIVGEGRNSGHVTGFANINQKWV